jgi:WD40 repeat protein
MLRQIGTGNLRRTLKQPQCHGDEGGPVEFWGLTFSQDATLLIAGEGRPGGGGGSIYAFDYQGYARPQLLRGYNFYVRDLSLSPDGNTLAVALIGSPELLHLQAQDGTTIDEFEGHTFSINSVSFSPDGSLIVSAGRDSTVFLWQSTSGDLLHTLEGHEDTINRVVFSPDGSLIASCSDDNKIILWGIENP